MLTYLRIIPLVLLSFALMLPSVASSAPSAQATLIDPRQLILDDVDLPRGFERMPSADKADANPTIAFVLRQHGNGSSLIQQIVYSAASVDAADEAGGQFVQSLREEYDVDFGELLTLGDKAVSGWGEGPDGIAINVVVFKRGTLTGAILWIDGEGQDLEADVVALAGKMDARARAALSR